MAGRNGGRCMHAAMVVRRELQWRGAMRGSVCMSRWLCDDGSSNGWAQWRAACACRDGRATGHGGPGSVRLFRAWRALPAGRWAGRWAGAMAGAMAGAIASIWSLQLCEQLVRCGSCEGGPGQGGCYGEHCGLWVNCLGFGGSCAGHVGPWHVRGMAGPACARHGGPGMCEAWRAWHVRGMAGPGMCEAWRACMCGLWRAHGH